MSLKLKIRGGTLSDKRLCDSCKYGNIINGSNGQEIVLCSRMGDGIYREALPFKVVECTMYKNNLHKELYELEEVGWVLEVKKGEVIGFRKPGKEERLILEKSVG